MMKTRSVVNTGSGDGEGEAGGGVGSRVVPGVGS